MVMELNFSKFRKLFYVLSAILVGISLFSIISFGLNLAIDFTGGSVLTISFVSSTPNIDEMRVTLEDLEIGEFTLQTIGENSITLKTKAIDEATHQEVLTAIGTLGEIEEGSEGFESIGPVIGNELKQKTVVVLIVALLAILLYIAMSFRKVSKPVRSWVYGATSIIALFHDVLITLGILILLGRFYRVELTIPIVTAFLTIFGYSINDSVVVFDRLRENLGKSRGEDFDKVVDKSLNQSLTRSVNTSFTTMLALLAIFFFGGASLRYFSLALLIGIGLGTYSSLFLATPLLASYLRFKERKYRK